MAGDVCVHARHRRAHAATRSVVVSRSSRPNPAVVIGLDTMQGLQTARLLAERDIEVHGVVTDDRHPFARTRTCTSVSVASTSTAIPEALATLAGRLPAPAVVYPCQDSAVRVVSEHRERLRGDYIVMLPEHQVVTTLMEKSSFQRHAEDHGLPVPRTKVLRDRSDALRAASELTFPCALKPTSRSPIWSKNTTVKAFEVSTPEAFLDVYDVVAGWVDSMVLQEWVVGPETNLFSVNAYFDSNGTPLATFVARKIRQWPVATGQSSLGIECRDDEVLDVALRTFASLPYRGLAYLEVKRDTRTGALAIIEPNIGRPTGRSAIAEAGHVEILDTMYCDAVGLALPAERTQQYGAAKWIHLRRDLMASAVLWRRGELSLREWRDSVRGPKYYAIWDRQDPGPFFGDLKRVCGESLSATRRRLSRTRNIEGDQA